MGLKEQGLYFGFTYQLWLTVLPWAVLSNEKNHWMSCSSVRLYGKLLFSLSEWQASQETGRDEWHKWQGSINPKWNKGNAIILFQSDSTYFGKDLDQCTWNQNLVSLFSPMRNEKNPCKLEIHKSSFSVQSRSWAEGRDKQTQLSEVRALILNFLMTNVFAKLSRTGSLV